MCIQEHFVKAWPLEKMPKEGAFSSRHDHIRNVLCGSDTMFCYSKCSFVGVVYAQPTL